MKNRSEFSGSYAAIGRSTAVSPPSPNPSNARRPPSAPTSTELDTLFASLQSRAFRGDL